MWLAYALLMMIGSLLLGAVVTHFQKKRPDGPGALQINVEIEE